MRRLTTFGVAIELRGIPALPNAGRRLTAPPAKWLSDLLSVWSFAARNSGSSPQCATVFELLGELCSRLEHSNIA